MEKINEVVSGQVSGQVSSQVIYAPEDPAEANICLGCE